MICADTSHCIWYCHDILQLPIIKNAIKKVIKKSCHSQFASNLFSDKIRTTEFQFIGFVASHVKGKNYQLVQIFQYVRFKVNFCLIISNECVRDVTLNYDTHLSYESMGFDTEILTQDRSSIGVFGIKTDHPIPIVQYGNRYSWAKHGYHVLSPDINQACKEGVNKSYHQALASLLITDLYKMRYFQIEIHYNSTVNELLNDVLPEDIPNDETKNHFERFMSDDRTQAVEFLIG